MSLDLLLPLLAGAAAGGFVNGIAGFGTALFSLGIWLQVLPPWQAVSIVAAMSVITGLQGAWVVRREIASESARLLRFLLPALIGLPIGSAASPHISASALKLAIAVFLLSYGMFFVLRRSLPLVKPRTSAPDMLVGLIGGALGGAASLSGAVPTLWCSMQAWNKRETRAILQSFNLVILALATALFAVRGNYTPDTLMLALIALPVSLLSSQLGIAVFRRLSDHQFRWLLILLLFASGVGLVARELT